MSIISAIQDYLKTYTSLEENAPVWVNYLGSVPVEYSIVPIAGEKIIEENIIGTTTRVFPFAFQMMGSVADDLARLNNVSFYEAFSAWLEQQTLDGVFPTLGAGQTPIEISANSWGVLFEEGQSETGVYQLTAQLIYIQAPGIPGT